MKIKLYIPDYEPIVYNPIVLEFGESEPFLILHGPNGCGKSTLLHLILGLKTSSNQPKIVVDDNRIFNTVDYKETIRYLPQNAEDGLFTRLSFEDNQLLLSELLCIKRKLNNPYKVDKKLQMGLLSVGMKKNILLDAILNSLPAVDNFGSMPLILLLDEPFAGLDKITKNDVFDKIVDISLSYKNLSLKFLIIDHQNVEPKNILATNEKILREGIKLESIICNSINKTY